MRLSSHALAIGVQIGCLAEESREVLRDLEEGARRGRDKHAHTKHEFGAALDKTRKAYVLPSSHASARRLASVGNASSGFPSTVAPTPIDKDEVAEIADVIKVYCMLHVPG